MSVLAAAALLCSLALFCPLLTIVGPMLGLRALIQIKADPSRRGGRLAWAAIAIGIVATGGWGVGLTWWHINARLPMMHGPAEALRAGIDGDVTAFRSWFHTQNAKSDEEAGEFLSQLEARYGRFIESHADSKAETDVKNVPRGTLLIAYVLKFEQKEVPAEAAFVLTENNRPPLILKFAWLTIKDEQLGDLTYPLGAASTDEQP